jgi:hypothetical protein
MSAITHEIIVKKAYKIVQQILEPHYNNSSEIEGEYKFVTAELEISLVSNKPKETAVVILFPNHEYIIGSPDLRPTQLNTDKKKLAYFIQNQLCKMYDILGKKYYESSNFILKWTNVTTWLPCIYPQFAFELTHNLPGKDFLENSSRFNAKFGLDIYDKLQYGNGNNHFVSSGEALLYKIKIELKGMKTEDGVEIIDSIYHHSNHNLLSTIIPKDYIDKTELWLTKSCNNENKDNILIDFVTHIIQIMKDNN